MNLYYQLYRKQLFIITTISLLALWAITSSIIALKKETEVRILYVEDNSVEVLGGEEPKLKSVFLQNFIAAYIAYCYNYDHSRFVANLEQCGDFMNPRLWTAKQPELTSAKARLDKEQYSLSTIIDRTPVILPNGEIQIDAKSTRTTELNQSVLRVRITLKVKKIPFFSENMTHYEVQDVKEEPI